ncbi:CHASE domain-containing protein [Pseudomonas sp. MMS21-TM103]|uniref:hybrid sensor histidine kinase/response regulator n=1 Tax=Pseudomonas sp. MMS21 TM103 TaxID=2886506 RepID=UPI001EDF59A6|nr:CHASE domain-containing protein [Pseudomonas sp. MMS21 TM103]MCG4455355.1 CHASE domain-containing protein [Pseudomonas sp. MMS21 TM103]
MSDTLNLMSLANRQAFFSRRNALAWAVLAIALLANLSAWLYLQEREQLAAQRQFELLTSEVSEAISKRMTDHEQILLGGAGLFDASLEVDRGEWRSYLERLELPQNYPGIQGVGYTRFLPPEAVAEFEAAVRREGFPNFRLHPPGLREQYSSILFLEPLTGRNLAAFGYDMMSEPTRRAAMLLAASSGETRISQRVTLLQETHGKVQAGLLMYVPVYRPDLPLKSPEQRLAALRGFVYSPYRMDDLMAGILGSQTPKLDFNIYDGAQARPEALLFSTQTSDAERHPELSAQLQLDLYGQHWTLDFSSLPAFEASFHTTGALMLLGVGVSLLLFVLASVLTLRREQAEALAHKMTLQIRQNSEALRQSEERQRLVLKGSNDGWWDIDLQAASLFASARAWEMLGYPPDESPQDLQRWLPVLLHKELAALQLELQRAVTSGAESFSSEALMLHRAGHQVPVLLRGFILRDADGQVQRLSGTLLDLSERKRVENMKNEFVSTVSHELRTPLTSIAGALGLITGGAMGEVPAQMTQMLQIAQQNSQRLSLLINDLLDMEKLAAGKMTLDLLVQPIKPLIEEALAANQAYAQQHGVSFQLDQPGDIWVRVDAARLQQVLANYLSNAIKFSPAGANVRLYSELRGNRVRVSVSDHGRGIPEAFHSRIFQKFAQADGSDRREQAGTGLGLAISKELIERMDGRVGFHSVPGQGATFWFELPLIEEHLLPVTAQRAVAGPRILVVEDEPNIVHLLQVILGHAGYQVDSAFSASQAQQRLAEGEYAAMTLDLRLGDGHGLALIGELRRQAANQQLPILVISAFCDEGRRLLGDAPGIAWLEKPFDEAQLLASLEQSIAAAAKRHSLEASDHDSMQ